MKSLAFLLKLSFSLFFLLSACAGPPSLENSSYILRRTSVAKKRGTPNNLLQKGYRTFTISSTTPENLRFTTRCAFEEKGYIFVSSEASPDFIISVQGSSPYKIFYYPPTETKIERRTPEGHIIYESLSSPAYTEHYYQPNLKITLEDPHREKTLWEAEGSGESDKKNSTLSNQVLLRNIISSIPEYYVKDPKSREDLGFSFTVVTQDSHNFFPIVTHVQSNQHRHVLRKNDRITKLNQRSLKNHSPQELIQLFKAKKQQKIDLELIRANETVLISLDPQELNQEAQVAEAI